VFPCLEIRRKAMVAATKTRREKGGGGSGSGFSGMRSGGSSSVKTATAWGRTDLAAVARDPVAAGVGVGGGGCRGRRRRRRLQGKGKAAACWCGRGRECRWGQEQRLFILGFSGDCFLGHGPAIPAQFRLFPIFLYS
jgi:hypothetical protein